MNHQIDHMSSFIVMEILGKAKDMENAGINIIHMEVGEPDFNVPAAAIEAAEEGLRNNVTHYTHALGKYELRKAIADMYQREYNVTVKPDNIVVTSGSSPAILMLSLMLFDKDSEVIVSNPGYACYKNFILAAGATPVFVNLRPENGFRYDIEDIRKCITPRTKAIFVNSPMNPTGAVMDEDFMRKLVALGIPIVSDEIYHGLVYGEKAHSILEYVAETAPGGAPTEAFVLNGFSKRFAMTGLRLGYLIAPEKYMPVLDMLHQNFALCAPSISQEMGIGVLNSPEAFAEAETMRKTYDERRLFLLKRLREIGLPPVAEPKGAFYIMVDARRFTSDSYRFAYDILEHAHVGVTPGVDFGTQGEGFLRLSYANSMENLAEGMNRLERYLNSL